MRGWKRGVMYGAIVEGVRNVVDHRENVAELIGRAVYWRWRGVSRGRRRVSWLDCTILRDDIGGGRLDVGGNWRGVRWGGVSRGRCRVSFLDCTVCRDDIGVGRLDIDYN